MTDGGVIEINSVREVPAPDQPLSVVVPLEDAATGSVEVGLGSDVHLTPAFADELSTELGMNASALRDQLARRFEVDPDQLIERVPSEGPKSQRGDVLRAALSENYGLPSSLLRGADRWEVTDVQSEATQRARVSFGRQGLRELQLTMSPDAAKDLKRGDVLIGTERLWHGGGALGLGRASVEFAPDPDPPAAAPIWIPVMRLHRPRHSSCEAAFTNQTKTTDSIDMKVEILGVGAGGGYEFGMTLKDEYVARTDCVETVIPAKLQLVPGKTLVNGTEIGYSIRAKVTDADVGAWRTRAIPHDQDDCERSGDALAGLISVPYNYSEAPKGDTDTQEISVESKAVGRMSVGLEVAGSVPINLGIDYERTTAQATTLRIVLATGVRYLAYAPTRHPAGALGRQIEICWTTKA
jgi:hypothetical protein